MKKYLFPLTIMLLVAAAASCQTTNPKMDQVKNDPKTAENAAKADTRLIDRKVMLDSIDIKATPEARKGKCRRFKKRQ